MFCFGALFLAAAFIWSFWPICLELFHTWSGNEDYSHGFFIIPVVIYLIYKKHDQIILNELSSNWPGFFCVLIAVAMYLVGLYSSFRTLANLSFVLAIWGSLYFLFGWRFMKFYAWELFLLLFMLPIPSRLYASITLPLQLGVTRMSFFVLQLLGVPVCREGNILQLANTTLEVVNACSGLRSILTIIVLSFVISCFTFRHAWQRLLLIITAVPLAMLTNLVRVTVVALFAQHGNVTFVDGTAHVMLGIGLFAFSLLLLTFFARMIAWLIPEK
jgi:exosortase